MKKTNKRGPTTKFNWSQIKNDYISDPTATLAAVAKKHGASESFVEATATKEKWSVLKLELQRELEEKSTELVKKDALDALVEVKRRQVRLGKILQKVGLEALEKYKYLPRSAKDAKDFIVDGMKLEREALGLDNQKNSGQVVNVINGLDKVIGQYVEGEIVEETKDGEK